MTQGFILRASACNGKGNRPAFYHLLEHQADNFTRRRADFLRQPGPLQDELAVHIAAKHHHALTHAPFAPHMSSCVKSGFGMVKRDESNSGPRLRFDDAARFLTTLSRRCLTSILSIAVRLTSTAVILGWLLSAMRAIEHPGLSARRPARPAAGRNSCPARSSPTGSFYYTSYRKLACWWCRRRLLPLIFLLTFALLAIGSVLYEPNNFDALSYRSPKVLYWLDQGHWHWIKANYEAMNYTMSNFEWLTVPLFLLTHGFHVAVVVNWIAFLLLPPLFFSLLRAFGATGRVAYDWMWLSSLPAI